MTDNNTYQSFKDKWEKNPSLAFQNTLDKDSEIFRWIINRNGLKDENELAQFLSKFHRILDAGCGNGRVTALLREYSNCKTTEIVAFDLVAAEVAKENLKKYSNIKIYSKDLLGKIDDLNSFDFIYCQEVLHHTKDPKQAFFNLVKLLKKNGLIAIYVYKRKAQVREFSDDFIRSKIFKMGYDESMKVCEQITQLGKALSESNISLNIPEVDILDIKAGDYSIQRFIYHFFMKCYWNAELSYHENVVINYDWYHPQNCSRHTMDEVKNWFEQSELKIEYSFEDFFGITIHGRNI